MDRNSRPGVFLALPSYSQQVNKYSDRMACVWPTDHRYTIRPGDVGGSLLAHCFNICWAEALSRHARGEVTYFAMLHADVQPEPFWLDILIDELDRLHADVVSAVIAIKPDSDPAKPDNRFLANLVTSTGIDDPSNRWEPQKRFTINQVSTFPPTFCAADIGYPNDALLINTGMWVCDLRKPWTRAKTKSGAAKVYFTINDRIEQLSDGTWKVYVEPEDWFFSRRLHSLGCKVYATSKVKVSHAGDALYSSHPSANRGVDESRGHPRLDERKRVGVA